MSPLPEQPDQGQPRDSPYWAQPVSKLKASDVPSGATLLNVQGRQVVGPLQGFGQLWQKSYRVRLAGASVTPASLVKSWREDFSTFWPPGQRFYAPLTGLAPGEVAILNLAMPGGLRLSTGVFVLYADEESFTFMTPEGHVFSGFITFSAYEEEGSTVAQVQVLVRANDPLYEIAARLFVFRKEDAFWHQTLQSLAAHFGVNGQVQQDTTCVDPRMQWKEAKNLLQNAAIRSGIHTMTGPLRWAGNLLRR